MSMVSVNGDGLIALMEGGWEHSALYEFMVTNHERMLTAFQNKRQQWTRLCPWFAENGLTDFTGKAPSPNTARITWYRVRRAMTRLRSKLDEVARQAIEAAEAKRLERDVKRETALAASRAVAPEPRQTWGVPESVWARPAPVQQAPRASAMPPIVVPPVPFSEPSVVDPAAGAGIEGLPDKAGYRSENQWYRDAAVVIRRKPGLERTTAEKLFILKVDMIGTQL